MRCDDVRAFVLAPDGALPPSLAAHAGSCLRCAALVALGARFDAALRSCVVAAVPASLAASLASLAAPPAVAPALDEYLASPATERVLRAALVVEPPAALQKRLMAIVETAPAVVAASRVLAVSADARPSVGSSEAAVAAAVPARVDALFKSSLVAALPAELQQRLLTLGSRQTAAEVAPTSAAAPEVARRTLRPAVQPDALLKASLVAAPPPELQQRLLALPELVADSATARVDAALRAEVVAEPLAPLQRQLAALAAEAGGARPWYQRLWAALTGMVGGEALAPRLGVFAAELAAVGVLIYALVQLVAWVSSLPIVLGDVPYAIALLVWSPAVDYLAQLQGLLQQLGLWLLVAGGGWIVAQGLPGRQQAPS
ncbi:MAG: hypothetical protein JO247_04680 [Chloroflexi bacterium]|nr:hypothetical protein [Chloroflexota bacterium]